MHVTTKITARRKNTKMNHAKECYRCVVKEGREVNQEETSKVHEEATCAICSLVFYPLLLACRLSVYSPNAGCRTSSSEHLQMGCVVRIAEMGREYFRGSSSSRGEQERAHLEELERAEKRRVSKMIVHESHSPALAPVQECKKPAMVFWSDQEENLVVVGRRKEPWINEKRGQTVGSRALGLDNRGTRLAWEVAEDTVAKLWDHTILAYHCVTDGVAAQGQGLAHKHGRLVYREEECCWHDHPIVEQEVRLLAEEEEGEARTALLGGQSLSLA